MRGYSCERGPAMRRLEPTCLNLFHYLAITLLLTLLGSFYVYRFIGFNTASSSTFSKKFMLYSEIADSGLKGTNRITYTH
jgi:hypothetical protein